MIEILKAGMSKGEWQKKFKGTCHTCECQLTCSVEDGEYVGSYGCRPSEGNFVRLLCPNCEKEMVAYG